MDNVPAAEPDSGPASGTEPSRYAERLWMPAWLWGVAALWPVTLAIAYGYALGAAVGWLVGAGLATLVVVGLIHLAMVLKVTPDGVWVGPAYLEAQFCGQATPLDVEQTREAAGVKADARAFIAIRGWIRQSVRLELDDSRDPTPYWLISTRHPTALAAAINDAARPKPSSTCEDSNQRPKET